jgi:hypothetical protein
MPPAFCPVCALGLSAPPPAPPSDWMFGAEYDAFAQHWHLASGVFNPEYTVDGIAKACRQAQAAIVAADREHLAITNIGIFPDTHHDMLRRTIREHGGHVVIAFPQKSFAFVPLTAFLARTLPRKNFFTEGVVIASFPSRRFTAEHTIPPSARTAMHEWAAMHCPPSLVPDIKWPGDGLGVTVLGEQMPRFGTFLPRWPELAHVLCWVAPTMARPTIPASPLLPNDPRHTLAHLHPKSLLTHHRGIMPAAFCDLLALAGLDTDRIEEIRDTHAKHTMSWLRQAATRAFEAYTAERAVENDLKRAAREAEALRVQAWKAGPLPSPLNPSPSPLPPHPLAPLFQTCSAPPPSIGATPTHSRFLSRHPLPSPPPSNHSPHPCAPAHNGLHTASCPRNRAQPAPNPYPFRLCSAHDVECPPPQPSLAAPSRPMCLPATTTWRGHTGTTGRTPCTTHGNLSL